METTVITRIFNPYTYMGQRYGFGKKGQMGQRYGKIPFFAKNINDEGIIMTDYYCILYGDSMLKRTSKYLVY